MLFEALPEHVAPNFSRRKYASRRPAATNVSVQPSSPPLPASHDQFEWPFPKARQATRKFILDAVHDGMKDAAKGVVKGAIIASGVAAIGAVGYFGLDSLKKKPEPPKMMQPWETTVTKAPRATITRP